MILHNALLPDDGDGYGRGYGSGSGYGSGFDDGGGPSAGRPRWADYQADRLWTLPLLFLTVPRDWFPA